MARLRRIAVALLCGLCASAGTARAAGAFDWLGPQRIGARLDEIAPHVALACGGAPARQACTAPAREEFFDAVPVQRIEAVFQDGQFVQGNVFLASARYPALLRTLQERYGPGEDRSFVAIAGMAAAFPAGVFIWRAGGVSVVLEQYAGKIDRARLAYGTHASMAGLIGKIRAFPRGARRDL